MMLKRVFSLFLSVVMIVGFMPDLAGADVSYAAEDTIATVDGKAYSKFSELVLAVSGLENKTFTIDMRSNWNAVGNDQFDTRLAIPSGSKVTLNMHGYLFNRDNARNDDWDSKGELITVGSDAVLVINGSQKDSERKTEHKLVPVFSSTNRDEKATKTRTITGGVLCGGNSVTSAGGIQIGANCTVTLNDVTIAGCKANDTVVTSGGTGGGVQLNGVNSVLRMNNSTITGCNAYDDGAGIFVYQDKCTVELNNSVIEDNYAYSNGGGIATDDEKISIIGMSGSRVSANHCGSKGAGLYLSGGEDIGASGLEVTGNKGFYGAGVYTKQEKTSLSSLVVKDNRSTKEGGGMYIGAENISISNCEVTNNSATTDGGGVYVYKNIDEGFNVTGKTVVVDNTAKGKGNNFHISDSDPDDTRVNFNLTKGSNVYVSYAGIGSNDSVFMVSEGEAGDRKKNPNCIQYLTAANKDYHFTYNTKPDQRKIYYVKDGYDNSSKYGDPSPEPNEYVRIKAVDANNASTGNASNQKTDAGIIGLVGPGGVKGSNYYLMYGFAHHQETDSDTNDSDSAFYYSDAFFDRSVDPSKYNEHLASASLTMAYTGMYLRPFEKEDANGNTYYNKHAAARQFMADIGCPDQNIYVNDSNVSKPGTDSIGVTIASKNLKDYYDETGFVLVPIVVRGGGYEKEWASNATLGSSVQVKGKEAQGFSQAASQVMEEIEKYIKKYDLEDELAADKVNFWITGYSRAGATANLTAKRLVEKYASDDGKGTGNRVFAYPCEAPMGGTDEAEKLDDKTKYYCIHNLINAADVVPLVAPALMGFKRYGVDHFIPGTDAGEVVAETKKAGRGGNAGPANVTTYRDNQQLYIKDNNRAGLKKVTEADKAGMLKQLRALDSGIVVDDYFHPMAMDIFPSPEMYEEGDYGGTNLEDFLQDFLRFAQEGNKPEDSSYDWSQAVKNRDLYSIDIQPALRDTLALVFSMSPENNEGFVGRASSIMNKMNKFQGDVNKYELYTRVIQEWHTLSQAKKDKYITGLWKLIEETGAFEFLSKSDLAKMERNWPLLAEFILTLVHADYKYSPGEDTDRASTQTWAKGAEEEMMYIPTFATYASYILMNHYPELNLAWARYYDSYYADDTKEFELVTDGWSVAKPSAWAGEQKLDEGTTLQNKLSDDQKIILENEDIVGEAIYYDLKDNDTGEMLASNQIYRGGIDLSAGDASVRSLTIDTYAISYGKRSETSTYNISLLNRKHRVIFESLDSQGNKVSREYRFEEKQKVTTQAGVPSDSFFTEWTIEMLDKDGNVLPYYKQEEMIFRVLGTGKQSIQSQEFTMPKVNSFFPEGYGLLFKANYKVRVSTIEEVFTKAPVPGQNLPKTFDLMLNNGKMISCPVIWIYHRELEQEFLDCLPSGKAYDETVYTAIVNVEPDKEKGILFGPEVNIDYYDDILTEKPDKVTTNPIDGSLRIEMTFPITENTGVNPSPDPELYEHIQIGAWDTSLENYDADAGIVDYYAEPDSHVTMICPVVPGEKFDKWEYPKGSGLYPASGRLTDKIQEIEILSGIPENSVIKANYVPVVSKIEVNLYDEEGNDFLPKVQLRDSVTAEAFFTVSNRYEIDQDSLEIAWTPDPGEGGMFVPGTQYTAKVSFKTDENGKIQLISANPNAGTSLAAPGFYPADNIEVLFNGISDDSVFFDVEDLSVSRVLPIAQVSFMAKRDADIKNVTDVPHGASKEEVMDLLQKSVTIELSDNTTREVPVIWNDAEPDKDEDSLEAILWTVYGTLDIPEDIAIDPSFDVATDVIGYVSVNEADHTSSPTASMDSGEYASDQIITLNTNEEGGTTYFTVGGEDPQEHGQVYEAGQEIHFTRNEISTNADGEKALIVKAFTRKDGQFDSAVTTYEYVFDNDVYVPEGNDELIYNTLEQTGVEASRFYTITDVKAISTDDKAEDVSRKARLNESGDAVAVEAGTYEATLHLTDPDYRWLIPAALGSGEAEEGGEQAEAYTTTTDDQKVTFIIKPLPIQYANISDIKDMSYTGKAVTQTPVLSLPAYGPETKLVEGRDYKVTYANNVEIGEAKVTIKGIGSCEDKITKTFKIMGQSDSGEQNSQNDYVINNNTIVLSKYSFSYNGKVQKPIIILGDGKKLKEGEDYTITWSNASSKKIGKYTVTVTGKGKYQGTAKATYKINPKGSKIKKVKKGFFTGLTVRWKKQAAKMPKSRITGYQLQFATNKKFTKNKKSMKIKGYKKVSKRVSKLKKNKKYYVRIRTYKTIKGVNYYSSWSKVKTVKTKK